MESRDKVTNVSSLRHAAEQMAAWTIVHPLQGETDARKLLHELQVHHIELEMQNAELNLARVESDKYLKNATDINQDLKNTLNANNENHSADQLVRRDALVKIRQEIDAPLKIIAQISQQIRQSQLNPILLLQLEKLEIAGKKILFSINDF